MASFGGASCLGEPWVSQLCLLDGLIQKGAPQPLCEDPELSGKARGGWVRASTATFLYTRKTKAQQV